LVLPWPGGRSAEGRKQAERERESKAACCCCPSKRQEQPAAAPASTVQGESRKKKDQYIFKEREIQKQSLKWHFKDLRPSFEHSLLIVSIKAEHYFICTIYLVFLGMFYIINMSFLLFSPSQAVKNFHNSTRGDTSTTILAGLG
jgi:hypothetical protein